MTRTRRGAIHVAAMRVDCLHRVAALWSLHAVVGTHMLSTMTAAPSMADSSEAVMTAPQMRWSMAP